MPAFRVAVLISGTGTNLQALLDTVHGKPVPDSAGDTIEIACVVASRSDAPGLGRAERAGV